MPDPHGVASADRDAGHRPRRAVLVRGSPAGSVQKYADRLGQASRPCFPAKPSWGTGTGTRPAHGLPGGPVPAGDRRRRGTGWRRQTPGPETAWAFRAPAATGPSAPCIYRGWSANGIVTPEPDY